MESDKTKEKEWILWHTYYNFHSFYRILLKTKNKKLKNKKIGLLILNV